MLLRLILLWILSCTLLLAATITSHHPMSASDEHEASRVVGLMQSASSYADRPSTVETIETHISWLFLTDRFVYKLKKPVRFSFLDFSTPALRLQACQNELRLNRRLAHDVYLTVLPITRGSRGQLKLAGTGKPVDYVVKMRRLPADRTLERLAQSGRLVPSDVNRVADKLATFYTRQAPQTLRPRDYLQRIRDHTESNLADLSRQLPESLEPIQKVHSSQLRFLRLNARVFDERVCDGRVVDGHGDLRPEHIYIEREPVVIDCVEFNQEYRENDILDELCFLAMECDMLGIESAGQILLNRYCDVSGDQPQSSIIEFFKCYRACVRAKVYALRAAQVKIEQQRDDLLTKSRRYVDLATRYVSSLGSPTLLVVSGLAGTGKSTLALALAESLHASVLRTDEIRRELFNNGDPLTVDGLEKYSAAGRQQVYKEMVSRARDELKRSATVILDGTFVTRSSRQLVDDVADQLATSVLFVRCSCPREDAIARIARRLQQGGDVSEARPELYDQQTRDFESYLDCHMPLEVDTTMALTAQVSLVEETLAKSLFDLASYLHSPL